MKDVGLRLELRPTRRPAPPPPPFAPDLYVVLVPHGPLPLDMALEPHPRAALVEHRTEGLAETETPPEPTGGQSCASSEVTMSKMRWQGPDEHL